MSDHTIGSRRLALVLTLVFIMIATGIVLAAQPPDIFPGQGNPSAYPDFYEDFESGSPVPTDWVNNSDIQIAAGGANGSFMYDVDNSGQGGTKTGPIELDNGTETIVFMQVAAHEINSDIQMPGYQFATDSQSNSKDCDGNNPPGYLDFNGGWHNVLVYYNTSGFIKTASWKPGKSVPNTWDYTTDTGCAYNQTTISEDNITFADSRGQVDVAEFGILQVKNELYGTVYNETWDPIEGATITVRENGTKIAQVQTDKLGDYSVELGNGTYDVTAEKNGFIPETESVLVEGQKRQDFRLFRANDSLELNTHPCLEHGERAPYKVTFINRTNNQRATVTDVSNNSTVISNNTSVVTVDQPNLQIKATNDTSVNAEVRLDANYTAPNGDKYEGSYNVTVANHTVSQLGKLCPVERFEASLRDGNILVIIIATGIGVAASVLATVFAGVGAFAAIMLMGWLMGETTDSMVIIAVLFGLFLGLNVGLNIDYEVSTMRGR